jgi:hypothetical protein
MKKFSKDSVMSFLEKVGFRVNSADAIEEIQPAAEGDAHANEDMPPAAPKPPDVMEELKSLIEEMGGVQALRDLLAACAQMISQDQQQQQTAQVNRRKELTEVLAEANARITADDLKDVPLKLLEKMAETVTANRSTEVVNWGGSGLLRPRANAGETVAAAPKFLTAKK